MYKNEEAKEAPKISKEAKIFAQENWTLPLSKIMEKLDQPENIKLLGERKQIILKINGIRKDQRQKNNPVAPQEDLKEESFTNEPHKDTAKIAVPETKKIKQRPDNVAENKTRGISRDSGERGLIISLSKATQQIPLDKKYLRLRGKRKGQLEILTYPATEQLIGAEIDISRARVTEKDDTDQYQIGDVRIVVPKNAEINNGILRGKFFLDVVTTQLFGHEGRAEFHLLLTQHSKLNGDKPVYKMEVDTSKKEPLPGTIQVSPTASGQFVHFTAKET